MCCFVFNPVLGSRASQGHGSTAVCRQVGLPWAGRAAALCSRGEVLGDGLAAPGRAHSPGWAHSPGSTRGVPAGRGDSAGRWGWGHLWQSRVPGGCPSPELALRALLTHPGAEPGTAQARPERMNRFRPGPSWFLRRGSAASSLPARPAHPSQRG